MPGARSEAGRCYNGPLSIMGLQKFVQRLRQTPELTALSEALQSSAGAAWVSGSTGSARSAIVAALLREGAGTALWISTDEIAAERICEDLASFGLSPESIGLYPVSPAELTETRAEAGALASSVAPERRALARRRLSVLQALRSGSQRLVVAPLAAVLRPTLKPDALDGLHLEAGSEADPDELARDLVGLGYSREDLVERPGQFARRGDLLDVWPSTAEIPLRVEFFDVEVESIRTFDPETQRSTGTAQGLSCLPASDLPASRQDAASLLDYLNSSSMVIVEEPAHLGALWKQHLERRRIVEVSAEATTAADELASMSLEQLDDLLRSRRVLAMTLLSQNLGWMKHVQDRAQRIPVESGAIEPARGQVADLTNRFRSWMGSGTEVWVVSDQPHRLQEVFREFELPSTIVDEDASPEVAQSGVLLVHGRLSAGFRLPQAHLAVAGHNDIYGDPSQRHARRRGADHRRFKDSRPILSFSELAEGDFVVHVAHGIGIYRGLEQRQMEGVTREFVRIDYAGTDRLFVPSEQLDRVQKYIGSGDTRPSVHRLGGAEWARTKSRVRAKVRELAEELIKLYAQRQAARGHEYGPDTVWQEEIESAFPYRETGDQMRAILDTKADMEKPVPMDRLVCGDVGYGKTEVALRAAFKAVTEGKQVAILAPTTLLASQHFNTFSERLASYPVRIEVFSRFRTPTEIKKGLADLKLGLIDIAIGTHRLLSKDVHFSDLGLLVVDEEQRFGVAHKERIKSLRANVDILTLTATPIPRTLHMSLAGLRDLSVMEEPPEGRLAVRTYCMEFDEQVVREAILRELDRGGQVFYLHNRVETIYRAAGDLKKLVPQARISIGHGQMGESELEDVMLDFYEGEYDVLVSTTIIESGLDIPNANTIIITNAHTLGLSQLHQLRGRVGRSADQAYCYLLTPRGRDLKEVAEQRLKALIDFAELGAGFKIAMRDMEIRGVGNLLGGEQSGHMISVGFNMYCQMIEDAVKELQGDVTPDQILPSVLLPITAYLPDDYVPTAGLRIAFYKKIAAARTEQDVAEAQAELEDRFGDPPGPVWNLLALMRLRIACSHAGISRIEPERGAIVIWMARKIDKEEQRWLYRHNKRIQMLPDRITLYCEGTNPLRPVENMVKLLAERGSAAAHAAVQRQLAAAEAARII